MKSWDYKIWLIVVFVIIYSLFVFLVDYTFKDYNEIVAATVFFFALFAGFFISRQNDRYNKVYEVITGSDGLFSYFYRIFGFAPKTQKNIKEVIHNHYQKIFKSGNWAYHCLNPSTTLTDLTNSLIKIDELENKRVSESRVYSGAIRAAWDVLRELQLNRKKMIYLYDLRLLFFQWLIIYFLGFLLIVSFNFIPTPEGFLVDILKIIFGTAVFLVVILLKQLNDLSLFGKDFSKKTAGDVLRIIEEKDIDEVGKDS